MNSAKIAELRIRVSRMGRVVTLIGDVSNALWSLRVAKSLTAASIGWVLSAGFRALFFQTSASATPLNLIGGAALFLLAWFFFLRVGPLRFFLMLPDLDEVLPDIGEKRSTIGLLYRRGAWGGVLLLLISAGFLLLDPSTPGIEVSYAILLFGTIVFWRLVGELASKLAASSPHLIGFVSKEVKELREKYTPLLEAVQSVNGPFVR